MTLRIELVVCLLVGLISGAALAQGVTISVALPDDDAQAQKLEGLIAEFEAESGIDVELLPQFRERFDRLAVQMAGGVAPDVFAGYGVLPGQVVHNGLALDLAPYIERDGVESLLEQFAPSAVEALSADGKVYGFPQVHRHRSHVLQHGDV